MTDAGDIGDVSMSETIHDFGSILGGVLSAPWLKGGFACIAVACEAMGLPLDLVWALVAFFVIDFVLGLWLAVRTRAFSLRKFARGFSKIPVYTLVLSIAWLCQYIGQHVLGQAVPVPLWACAYLAMHESISIPSTSRKATRAGTARFGSSRRKSGGRVEGRDVEQGRERRIAHGNQSAEFEAHRLPRP